MDATTPPLAAAQAGAKTAAQLAKAALRRLVAEELEPTPENFARAYVQEGGSERHALPQAAKPIVQRLAERAFGNDARARAEELWSALGAEQWDRAQALIAADDKPAAQWPALVERVVRGVERGSKSWTTARKKESLQRVLDGSRRDLHRLQQRLSQLLASWESDAAPAGADPTDPPLKAQESRFGSLGASQSVLQTDLQSTSPTEPPAAPPHAPARTPEDAASSNAAVGDRAWNAVFDCLTSTLASTPSLADTEGERLRRALANGARKVREQGASPESVGELQRVCAGLHRVAEHRQHLTEQLATLSRELATSMTELAESGSWVQGQCEAMRVALEGDISVRAVRAVQQLLRDTRQRQVALRTERKQARDALKGLIASLLGGLTELGSHTGRFHDQMGRYTEAIEKADSLESLAGVVREMADESRTVGELVAQTRARLEEEHSRATSLHQRVGELEEDLRRLSNEVTTDQLTQVANRRGLLQAFEIERARMKRDGAPLAVGLLDLDNFKRLNDELGHTTGDEALKALAALISKTLRTTDHVARYGGEEFVVLLPDATIEQAQRTLTRLQRSLSGGLFLNEHRDVLVTFSAGVTACGAHERIEDVLDRADRALYEAKRSGKNRTCVA